MTTDTFRVVALDPGLSLLPGRMDTPEARVMVAAICIQESELVWRRQVPTGPGRSYAQFERGPTAGIAGVLKHAASRDHAVLACKALDIPPFIESIYAAVEFSDVLCVVFSRLLLWTLPYPLPDVDDADEGWRQYREAWRPGRPRPEKWAASHARAVEAFGGR